MGWTKVVSETLDNIWNKKLIDDSGSKIVSAFLFMFSCKICFQFAPEGHVFKVLPRIGDGTGQC
jgi:hypothetical protein